MDTARRLSQLVLLAVPLLLGVVWLYGRSVNRERMEVPAAVPGALIPGSHGLTHYELSGPDTGATAVLVHGFSVPMYIWDSTVTALRDAGYRTLRYDLYGRGFSARPDAAYDRGMFVAQLVALLDSLRIRGAVHLMGVSFGGYVTAAFVAAHPDRVASLTLLDPVFARPELPAFLAWPAVGSWFWQTVQVPQMPEGQRTDFLNPDAFPDWVDRYRDQMQYRGFGRALLRSAQALAREDLPAIYGRVGAAGKPVLLIWGKQDRTTPIAGAEVIRRALPQARFFPVDSAGHLPHMEQADTVRRIMLDFLRSVPQ